MRKGKRKEQQIIYSPDRDAGVMLKIVYDIHEWHGMTVGIVRLGARMGHAVVSHLRDDKWVILDVNVEDLDRD